MTDQRRKGNLGEAAVERYLRERGCTVLDRQWRCRYGELDLVARDSQGTVCFVEVKLRGPGFAALPRDAVTPGKRRRLRTAAALWLEAHAPDAPARFDVAEVYAARNGELRVEYLEAAFE